MQLRSVGREGPLSANPLDDGRVLCLGGYTGQHGVVIGSVFDPAADSWEAVAPLARPRYQHATQALGDGRFVVTGGIDIGALVTPEIYELS